MPRRPRIDMVGYYHIVNRGVEQRVIYKEHEDYETFLEMLCMACKLYDVQLHGYVLMNNHYHLLIETTRENLSKFMKHINASYAIYFNRKYKRSGHLWQGRFKSWYVTDEAYLYALISYIHNNPVKAKIVNEDTQDIELVQTRFVSHSSNPVSFKEVWVVKRTKDNELHAHTIQFIQSPQSGTDMKLSGVARALKEMLKKSQFEL